MSAAAAAFPDARIERWELHSELVLVSAEVRARALELLPKRDPDASLRRARRTLVAVRDADVEEPLPALATAVFAYTLVRLVQTTRSAIPFFAAVVALATIVELLH
jgi:hypothetical protein